MSLSDLLKVHVHTDTPEAVFTYALSRSCRQAAFRERARGVFYQVEDE